MTDHEGGGSPGFRPGAPAPILVATGRRVLRVDREGGRVKPAEGLEGRAPTCLAATPPVRSPRPPSVADVGPAASPGSPSAVGGAPAAWCGTHRDGILGSDDDGRAWTPAGLAGEHVTAVATDPAEPDVVWAGTEPSAVWRSEDRGGSWTRTADLAALPSSPQWAFPPKPETHHVRWIACHPARAGRLWVAIEAGALVRTRDGGRSWLDRTPTGPRDTHELAVHPDDPETLRVAAGDGYFESRDGGDTWSTPSDGLEVGYLRSVAVDPGDPEVVLVSGASRPRSTYVSGSAAGRVYRREGEGRWVRVRDPWPDPPSTIAPLLRAGARPGEFWAADERGVFASTDGGRTWRTVASFESARGRSLRGMVVPAG